MVTSARGGGNLPTHHLVRVGRPGHRGGRQGPCVDHVLPQPGGQGAEQPPVLLCRRVGRVDLRQQRLAVPQRGLWERCEREWATPPLPRAREGTASREENAKGNTAERQRRAFETFSGKKETKCVCCLALVPSYQPPSSPPVRPHPHRVGFHGLGAQHAPEHGLAPWRLTQVRRLLGVLARQRPPKVERPVLPQRAPFPVLPQRARRGRAELGREGRAEGKRAAW